MGKAFRNSKENFHARYFNTKIHMEINMKTPKKLIGFSILIVVLSILLFRDIKNVIDNSFLKGRCVLIIGILSAPENFQKRLSIRKTWLKLASDISVTYYFVVGKHRCRIHPLDRINAFSCNENVMSLPMNVSSEMEFNTLRIRNNNISEASLSGFIGFGFQTFGNIIIKKLGIVKSFFENYDGEIKVKLISQDKKVTLASVTISPDMISSGDGFFLKSIYPVSLGQNSEAQVVIETVHKNISLLPTCECVEWNFMPGIIKYQQLIQVGDKKPWPFYKNSCSYALMKYQVSDVNILKAHMEEKEQRKKEWQITEVNVMAKLENESHFYRDLKFMDVIDVYQNLPQKLIQFFKWLMETEYFDYVLKADDDSFIDILRVYKQLLTKNRDLDDKIGTTMEDVTLEDLSSRPTKLWWWSYYREFWRVQESGKWRDDKYRSPSYPPFPCGGGYVLSRGIVAYLSKNSGDLQYFQGEDVSVGIWLSGLRTIRYKAPIVAPRPGQSHIQEKVLTNYGGKEAWPRFLNLLNGNRSKIASDNCEWTCDNNRIYDVPLCNKVQLTEAEMNETWTEYSQRGFI